MSGKDRMKFKIGNFLKLADGQILEVIYADSKKAICLKVKYCYGIGFTYTGSCTAIANSSNAYEDVSGIEIVPNISISGEYCWEPLKPLITFPM